MSFMIIVSKSCCRITSCMIITLITGWRHCLTQCCLWRSLSYYQSSPAKRCWSTSQQQCGLTTIIMNEWLTSSIQVGRTPFHNAAFFGRKNVVKVMLSFGMKLGAKDKVSDSNASSARNSLKITNLIVIIYYRMGTFHSIMPQQRDTSIRLKCYYLKELTFTQLTMWVSCTNYKDSND